VYGYIRNGYGVAVTVDVTVSVAGGVIVSMMACGVGSVVGGTTGWQAARPIRINSLRHCFID
jgi:hypothetical protein